MSQNGGFEPNPGREPFGARFWEFDGSSAGCQLVTAGLSRIVRFEPNPGRGPFGARFWEFGGFWASY